MRERRLWGLRLATLLALVHVGVRGQASPLQLATDSNDLGGLAPSGRAILRRAFERLGLQIRFEPLPLRRSLPMSIRGTLDGECLRIRSLAEEHRELLLVPVSIAAVEVWAYVRETQPLPRSLEDLLPQRVGYARGVVLLEKLLASVAHKVEASSQADVLRLLRAEAVDVALLTLAAGQPAPSIAHLPGLRRADKPLHSTPLYPLLHQRHARLVPPLAEVLRTMEASGESAQLRNKSWAELGLDGTAG